eukprot:s20_g43.t1
MLSKAQCSAEGAAGAAAPIVLSQPKILAVKPPPPPTPQEETLQQNQQDQNLQQEAASGGLGERAYGRVRFCLKSHPALLTFCAAGGTSIAGLRGPSAEEGGGGRDWPRERLFRRAGPVRVEVHRFDLPKRDSIPTVANPVHDSAGPIRPPESGA